MKEKNIQELAKRMGLVTVEDMCQYTITQLVYMIANKMNELIDEVGQFESDVIEDVKSQNEKIQHLLGEGLLLEVENVFNGWVQDGTFDTLLNQTALKKVNDRIDMTNDFINVITHSKIYINSFPRLKDELDDTNRIRRAFDYVKAHQIKELIFTDGDYLITPTTDGSEVGIIIPNDLLMCGVGNVTIKTKMHEPYNGLFALDQGLGAKNVTIKNIKFSNLDDTHSATFKDGNNPCILLRIGDTLGDVVVEDCEFHSYAQNAVVSFPFHTSDGKVTFRRNKFYFSRHINEWYDATLLSIGHYDVEYVNNYFESINNGTKSWMCDTPFEVHSRKCRAYGNDCYNFVNGTLIVGVPPYLPLDNTVKSDIKVYNNNFVNVRNGIQVWGEVVPTIANTTINNIDVYENNIIIQHNHNYNPVNIHNQLSGYGLSVKVVGNVGGYENIKFHHNNLEFVQIGEHNYSSSDIFLTQRGAISVQSNVPTKDVQIYDNKIKNYPYETVVVGNDGSTGSVFNIFIKNNIFIDCSYGSGVSLFSFNNCDSLHVTDNFIVNETKKYDNFIHFTSPAVAHLTLLNNEISAIKTGSYDLSVTYDNWDNMVNNFKTMKYDVVTMKTINDPLTHEVIYKDTKDGLNLFKGDVVMLTSGANRMAVVTSQFANTKTYPGMKALKSDGNWITVNTIPENMEVGDVINIGGSSVTVVSCLDYSTNKIRGMRFVPVFENQEKTVEPVAGTFNIL